MSGSLPGCDTLDVNDLKVTHFDGLLCFKFCCTLSNQATFRCFVLLCMNILVLNLSENIIRDDLLQIFRVYGEVSYVVIVRDEKTGRSKGSAFIEMPREAEGEQAIAALNRLMLDGREITVQQITYEAGEFNN